MFLGKEYILANELVQKMGIHIANISMLSQEFEDKGNSKDIKKMNSCNFINTKSIDLPNNIQQGIIKYDFTSLENKVLATYFRNEFGISDKEIMNSSIIEGKEKIAGKDFYVFKQEFVDNTKGKILYTLDKLDTSDCIETGCIDGWVQMSKNKYLTWY